jgi:hypothetical protein
MPGRPHDVVRCRLPGGAGRPWLAGLSVEIPARRCGARIAACRTQPWAASSRAARHLSAGGRDPQVVPAPCAGNTPATRLEGKRTPRLKLGNSRIKPLTQGRANGLHLRSWKNTLEKRTGIR